MKFNAHPDTCSCCKGITATTPLPVANRPGLPDLNYRIGKHGDFLESMKARLSRLFLEVDENGVPLPWQSHLSGCEPDQDPWPGNPCYAEDRPSIYPLRALSTRRGDDPAIAFLDAWAMVADVLTFYQERIANEGYLRTALERRSVEELARLVGYKLRPGVAASVYLAFELDQTYQVDIPAGTRSQSVPQPGELPQFFENSDALPARYAWNAIPARSRRPQYIALGNIYQTERIYLQGLSTQLAANDPLLFVFGDKKDEQAARFVSSIETVPVIEPVPGAGYTIVELQPLAAILAAQKAAAQNLPPQAFGVQPNTQIAQNLVFLLETQALIGSESGLTSNLNAILNLVQNPPPGAGSNLRAWLKSVATNTTMLLSMVGQPPQAAAAQVLAGTQSQFPFLAQTGAQAKEPLALFANGSDLPRDLTAMLDPGSDVIPGMITTLKPGLKKTFYHAWGSAQTSPNSTLQQVAALRVKAGTFGNNAPLMPLLDGNGAMIGETEWPLEDPTTLQAIIPFSQHSATTLTAFARILVRSGGQAFTLPVSSFQGSVLTLPVGTVEVSSLADNMIEFHFLIGGVDRTIHFRVGNQIVEITMDGALIGQLGLGDTMVLEPDKGHRVTAFFNGSGFGLTDENLVPPDPRNLLFLDAAYDQIQPGSWLLIDRPGSWPQPRAFQVYGVDTISKTAYKLSGKSTRLVLSEPWLENDDLLLSDIRSAVIYAQSEPLTLVDEFYDDPVENQSIELDGLYDGLESGRWIFVRGERVDIPGASDVEDAELAMIATVTQGVQQVLAADGSGAIIPRPNDKAHTTLELAQPLNHSYARDSVIVHANVAKATHGETHREIIGSGDARKAFQSFQLRQSPLTYISAPTVDGAKSTLNVWVNNIRWPEVDSLLTLGESDRGYELRRDDDGEKDLTTVIFGDGLNGARLPSGAENVEAIYRSGIGKNGNVAAETIKMLITRPLGVKGVNNPLAASGGADRDTRDDVRRNAPLAVMALDRLVSAQDYEDFARKFAGIGKSSARIFPRTRGRLVHVTIAGVDNIPIDVNSDLYRNLNLALRRFGDPSQPVEVDVRELLLLFVSANVRVLPDYRWESVEPEIRAALLDSFGFERRLIGQDVYAAEIIAAIQQTPGVAFVDLDYLESFSEEEVLSEQDLLKKLPATLPPRPKEGIDVHFARPGVGQDILPAQLAILSPDNPETLILTEIP